MKRRSGYGWFTLIIGILLVILGGFSLVRPEGALTGIAFIYGLIAVVTGISDIVFYVRTEQYTGFGSVISLISGILSVMAGIMVLAYPHAGKWIMVLLLPIWFIAHCISRLSHLYLIRIRSGNFYYYFTMIVNIVGIVLGCLMIARPTLALVSAGILIGLYLILLGIDMIVTAISNFGSR